MPRIDRPKRRRTHAGAMAIALGGLLLVGVGATGVGAAANRSSGSDGTSDIPAAICQVWRTEGHAAADGHRFPGARCVSWHTPAGG